MLSWKGAGVKWNGRSQRPIVGIPKPDETGETQDAHLSLYIIRPPAGQEHSCGAAHGKRPARSRSVQSSSSCRKAVTVSCFFDTSRRSRREHSASQGHCGATNAALPLRQETRNEGGAQSRGERKPWHTSDTRGAPYTAASGEATSCVCGKAAGPRRPSSAAPSWPAQERRR